MIANVIKFLPFAWIGAVILDTNFGEGFFNQFYQSLSTGLTMILITIVWRYVKKTDDMFKELKEAVQAIIINDKVQENKIKVLDRRVDDLEDNQKLVKYKNRN